MYSFLADVLVTIHFAYVAYVILGLLLILIGLARRWQWVRSPWFRFSHLLMILIVAAESLGGIMCPLTRWEQGLRRLAGTRVDEGSFIGWILNELMFCNNIPFDHWIFKVSYVGFGLIVLAAFLVGPPRLGKAPLPPPRLIVPRRTAALAMLGCAGLILLFAATCVPDVPNDTPVYLLALSGLHFLGLMTVVWAWGPRQKLPLRNEQSPPMCLVDSEVDKACSPGGRG